MLCRLKHRTQIENTQIHGCFQGQFTIRELFDLTEKDTPQLEPAPALFAQPALNSLPQTYERPVKIERPPDSTSPTHAGCKENGPLINLSGGYTWPHVELLLSIGETTPIAVR
jgi:hypothetical protein